MSLVVYLDLDRTAYNTDLSGRLIWQEIANSFGVDGSHEYDRQRQFYVYNDESYAYDLSAHLLDLGLSVDNVYGHLRRSSLADGRLEYLGLAEFVSWARGRGEIKVLTYGVDDYQRLKASLCPSLSGVEIITTLGSKAEYLANKGEVWLIDDKFMANDLPPNVRFLWMLQDGQDAAGRAACRSFADAVKAIIALQ